MTHADTDGDRAAGVTIYHNPACGTSRAALALIRDAGIEPRVVDYLRTPPTRAVLADLIARAGITPRALLREKEPSRAALGADIAALSDDTLIDAMVAQPILMNRPLVVSPLGVALCRPAERVLDLIPASRPT